VLFMDDLVFIDKIFRRFLKYLYFCNGKYYFFTNYKTF
jgi:hypothetical protein